MNESLEGHTGKSLPNYIRYSGLNFKQKIRLKGQIACITWNDMFNKLTTADTNGKIVVWINHDGI